jgi:hypothetical protein
MVTEGVRAQDWLKEVNDRLQKFSLDSGSGVKALINLSREKKHLLDLLFYILTKDEGFDKGRFGIYVRFAFPLSSGKFLGTGFTLFSDRRIVDSPVIVDVIEDGNITNPTMWIVALPNFYLFDDRNRAERFRIYDLLEDLGFDVQDISYYPYIKYTLNANEYLLEEE